MHIDNCLIFSSETAAHSASKSPKKRGSLSKQVSFKDISEDFLETDIPKSKAFSSPEKDKNSTGSMLESPKIQTSTPIKRSEKANLSKDEDMAWLNYFSPKKSSKPQETKRKNKDPLEKGDFSDDIISKPVLKRQSSADWLGLSDSKFLKNDDVNDNDSFSNVKRNSIDKTNLKITKPKTVSAPVIRPQKQETKKVVNELQDNDFIKSVSQPSTVNLSEILKDTDVKLPDTKNKSPSHFFKESTENVPIFKNIKDPKMNSNIQYLYVFL